MGWIKTQIVVTNWKHCVGKKNYNQKEWCDVLEKILSKTKIDHMLYCIGKKISGGGCKKKYFVEIYCVGNYIRCGNFE